MAQPRLAQDGGQPVHSGPWPRWPQVSPADEAAVLAVLRAGTWCSATAGAAEVRAFEREFADLHRPPRGPDLDCVAVSSGTAALILALQAAGVGPGDEVIVPPYTFIATVSACLQVGAVPVFADLDPATLCLDPRAASAAWSVRTRAVIPVHFAGCPADPQAFATLCQSRGAVLVEDACQAPGAAWQGQPVGSFGLFGCFSFQESKNLSAGEGGAVTGRGEPLERVWSLHNAGRTRSGAWYGHARIGQNLRLTALQTALLRSQLQRFPAQAARRAQAAATLTAALAHIPGIEPLRPPVAVTAHAWHLFAFDYDPTAFGGHERGAFLAALRAEGVPATAGYTLLADNAAVIDQAAANATRAGIPAAVVDPAALAVARHAAKRCCWLHQAVLLADAADLQAIPEAIRKLQRAWG